MAMLLLVREDKKTRGQDLRRTLLHLMHGFHAIENALSSFSISFASRERILAIDGHPDILAEFDAHVGDTACHMRAQMVWEVYEYYKVPGRRAWIDLALIALGQVKMQTVDLMIALHKKKGYMRALGFDSIVPYSQIFDRIGWSAFIDILRRGSSSLPEFGASQADFFSDSTMSSPMPRTPADLECIPLSQEDVKIACQIQTYACPSLSSSRSVSASHSGRTYASVSALSSSKSISSSAVSTSSGAHSYRSVTADCTWDVTDHLTIVRFLTICRLLSVGKRAKVQSGFPNASIRARTDPEFIYDQAEKEIKSFYDSAELREIEWKQLITEQDRMKKTFLIKEEETAQVWLSNLTADWTVSLAKEVGLSDSMQRLLKQTIVISPRQIACVASHPSIVPIRAEWLLRGTPIIMLIRRFCSHGYHNSFYRVIPNTLAWGALPPIKNSRAVGLGKPSWFSIQHVTVEEVCAAPWSTTPHFVLISNSIDGTSGEFYDRIAQEGYGDFGGPCRPHGCDDCEEYNGHVTKVLESNFAKIVMGFFGQHDQYPFDPARESVDEDEFQYVAKKMREEGFGRRALEQYWCSVEEGEESGTGGWPWMYTLEHAFTELPFVVGRQVKDINEKKVYPVPIGYRWW